jgi:4,5-dihydroxyphthalate decarboxylase
MTPLEIEFPIMRYDHTMPLLEGRVEIEGVALKPVRTNSMVFNDVPELREGRFGLWDLNMGYLLPAIEAGWEIAALPVFSKRKPVYTYIFCRTDRSIDRPKDLEGKRIGTGSYPTSITVWVQGLLQDRHGVDVSRLTWVALNSRRVFPLHGNTAIEPAKDPKKSPWNQLLDGDVDAIITDISDGKAFEALEASDKVKRLFPDYQAEDRKLYRETGVYTPMHLIVMSKRLDREHPELAGKLYRAFERAKEMAYEDILNDRAGFSVVYLRERLVEQMRDWGDPWRYGFEANRAMIDAFIRYNREQGMIRSEISATGIFAAGALAT